MESFKDKFNSVGDALDSNAFTSADDDRNETIDEVPSAQDLDEGSEHQSDSADQQGMTITNNDAAPNQDR